MGQHSGFVPLVNELDVHRLRRSFTGGAQSLKRKITAKHSFPGFKNQVTVNSEITLQRLRMGIEELFYK